MSLARAAFWSCFWVSCSLLFAAGMGFRMGPGAAQLFLASWVLEKALSLDNLMIFSAIFTYFAIPYDQRPGILYLGFIGAIVLRFLFLVTGAEIAQIHPLVGATFGAFVLWTAWKMFSVSDADQSPEDYEAKWFVRLARRYSTSPAMVCLVAIEISDILFSFDSMPAVIAISKDPWIIYPAVLFAVLGLRSMYFVLDALMRYLSRLGMAVTAILAVIGLKLIASSVGQQFGFDGEVGPTYSVGIIVGLLAFGVLASIIWPEAKHEVV